MVRLLLLTLVTLTALGCGARAHRSTPVAAAVRIDTVAMPVGTMAMSDSSMRRAFQRINRDVAAVDTIVVHPDSLVLHVGQAIPLMTIRIEARDSSGAWLPYFARRLKIDDQTVAKMNGPELVGLHPGETHLVIRPVSPDRTVAIKPIRALVLLRVVP